MANPEPDYATLLDENSYIKSLFEAEDLVRNHRQMSGDYDEYPLICDGCGKNLPCRHCAE